MCPLKLPVDLEINMKSFSLITLTVSQLFIHSVLCQMWKSCVFCSYFEFLFVLHAYNNNINNNKWYIRATLCVKS